MYFLGLSSNAYALIFCYPLSTYGFKNLVNFGRKGEVLDYNKTLMFVFKLMFCINKSSPLMLACTLPFVSSKDMMEKVLLGEKQ